MLGRMLPGPIFNVELITSARRTRYYLVRLAYSGALLIAFWTTCSEPWYSGPSQLSTTANLTAQFFVAFSWIQIIAVLALGPAIAAGTIASERQRRTIEYLFASTLSNGEIVFGKLLARLLHLVVVVLVGVPVLALAMMLGGIAPEALLVLTIITLSTAVTVTTLSIALSVWTTRPRDAISRAYLVLAAFLIIPPVLYAFMQSTTGLQFSIAPLIAVNDQLLAAHPLWVLGSAVFQASTANTADAWLAVGAMVRNHAIATVLAGAAAALLVRRVHLRQAGRAPRRQWRWRQRLRPAMGERPVFWKEAFAPSRGGLGIIGMIAVALLVGVVLLVLGWSYISYLENSSDHWAKESFIGAVLSVGTVAGCLLVLVLLVRAASVITSEKESGSWDVLLSTPLSPGEIVGGKVFGSMASLWPALLLMALIWSFALLVDPPIGLAVAFILLTLLCVSFFAAVLGVTVSLRCGSTLWAMGLSAGIGLYIGGMYMLCCCSPFVFAGGPGDDAMALGLAPCVPFLLAAPGIIYMEGDDLLRHSPEVFVAYVIGLVGYPAAAWVTMLVARESFEKWAGRVVRRPFAMRMQPPPASTAEAAVVAEVMDQTDGSSVFDSAGSTESPGSAQPTEYDAEQWPAEEDQPPRPADDRPE